MWGRTPSGSYGAPTSAAWVAAAVAAASTPATKMSGPAVRLVGSVAPVVVADEVDDRLDASSRRDVPPAVTSVGGLAIAEGDRSKPAE